MPEESKLPDEGFEFNDIWYELLQKVPIPSVVDPEQAEIEAAIAASMAQAENEDKAAKNADELLFEKLKEMRKVKPKVEQKKKKIHLKHLYHSSFFYKILYVFNNSCF